MDKVKKDKICRACSMHGTKRILLGKLGGKRSLGEDNSKMDLRKIGRDGTDWIHLDQDRDRWRALVNTVMSLRVPQDVGKFLSS
jgi:hypothetical protein